MCSPSTSHGRWKCPVFQCFQSAEQTGTSSLPESGFPRLDLSSQEKTTDGNNRTGDNMRASNKKRLYIAIYPSNIKRDDRKLLVFCRKSGFEDSLENSTNQLQSTRFHWALLVGPKREKKEQVPGRKYAVVPDDNTDPAKPASWKYEETELPDIKAEPDLLARIIIAKIEDEGRFHQILRGTPVDKKGTTWSCRTWVKDVLKRLKKDENRAVGTSVLDWKRLEPLIDKFVYYKAPFPGDAKNEDLGKPAPTWSMLTRREIYP